MPQLKSMVNSLLFEELEPRLLFSADIIESVAVNVLEQDYEEEPAVHAELEAGAESDNAAIDPAEENESVVTAEPVVVPDETVVDGTGEAEPVEAAVTDTVPEQEAAEESAAVPIDPAGSTGENESVESSAIPVMTSEIVFNAGPVLDLHLDGPLDYNEGDPATIIAPDATVIDIDSDDFFQGTLTVSFSADGSAGDQLVIVEGGNVSLLNENIKVDQWLVGSFSGGTDGTALVVSWHPIATPERVQEVLRQIAYLNNSDDPSTVSRIVDFVVTDGDDGTSNLAQQTINVIAVNNAPVVMVNDPLILEQGATEPITTSRLQVTDPDNIAEVTYTLTEDPAKGTLELDGVVLGISDTFSQADIDAELLRYVHGGADSAADSFTFTVADGLGGTVGPTVHSINVQAPPANIAPMLIVPGGTLDYNEGDPATIIAPAATVTDVDSDDFFQGTLTVGFSVGGSSDDQLVIVEGGDVSLLNQNIKVDQWLVGSFSGGTDGTALVVSWSPLATPVRVQEVMQQIAYCNSSGEPSTVPRTVDFVLTDGDGGISNTVQQTINVTSAENPAPPPVPIQAPDPTPDPAPDPVPDPDKPEEIAPDLPPDDTNKIPGNEDQIESDHREEDGLAADTSGIDTGSGSGAESPGFPLADNSLEHSAYEEIETSAIDNSPRNKAGSDQTIEQKPLQEDYHAVEDEPPAEMYEMESGHLSTQADAAESTATQLVANYGGTEGVILDVIRTAAQSALDFITPSSAVAAPYSPDSLSYGNPVPMNEMIHHQIEIMRQEMDQSFLQSVNENRLVVYTTTGMSVSITAGIMSYLLRTGSLLSSLLATIPLWKEFDPVAILSTPAGSHKMEMPDKEKNQSEDAATADQKAETMFAGGEAV